MSGDFRGKIKGRLYFSVFIFFLCFCLLGVKLFWISFAKGDEYSEAALNQRQRQIRVQMPRGMIYDRNLIPLTNRQKQLTMFVFHKDILYNNEEVLEYVKNNTLLSNTELNKLLSKSEGLVEIPLKNKSPKLKGSYNGVIIVYKVKRYHKDNLLSHVIGYVHRSEYTGASGIELEYDKYDGKNLLKMDYESGLVSFTVDGKDRPILGMGLTQVSKDNRASVNSVQLTIDYHIQKIVEEVIDNEKRNGAVIVTDVDTGDILAMVSRPNFNQSNVSEHENSKDMDLYNKAIQVSYPPGSIFKIVVLLSALENDIVNLSEEFECDGSTEVTGKEFSCHKKSGHGKQSLKEAFSNSCNVAFIEIGERLGGERIMETAQKLGFGSEINIGPLNQTAGGLPEGYELVGPAIGNISIGQGKIQVTPLQVTNMMMIFANEGIEKDLSIIKGIVTEEGFMVKPWINDRDKIVASNVDTILINKYMGEVFDNGTARHLKLGDIGSAAGKTGSAQSGVNNEIVHGWISGYFPRQNPKYVITVFVEKGGSGGRSAGPIFEKIANEISKINK